MLVSAFKSPESSVVEGSSAPVSPTTRSLNASLARGNTIQNFHFTAEVCFYGPYGLCGVCVAIAINSGIRDSINNIALNTF